MGGETLPTESTRRDRHGLSPRGRGNRSRAGFASLRLGSIPAWAGKPSSRPTHCRLPAVYPRVGGETLTFFFLQCSDQGLSPRGRGNPPGLPEWNDFQRSIPAWAGNRINTSDPIIERRSIPAWAGKPVLGHGLPPFLAVYPRVGGETTVIRSAGFLLPGLSPRGRGNRQVQRFFSCHNGSIPAWAGKPWASREPAALAAVYPRVGGETVSRPVGLHVLTGLSPRGRGNHFIASDTLEVQGSIPAWAGKPPESVGICCGPWVYPRVGGETA